jgi:hypothetical protein
MRHINVSAKWFPSPSLQMHWSRLDGLDGTGCTLHRLIFDGEEFFASPIDGSARYWSFSLFSQQFQQESVPRNGSPEQQLRQWPT